MKLNSPQSNTVATPVEATMKDNELIKAYGPLLETGRILIVAAGRARNVAGDKPNVVLYLAQQRPITSGMNLDSDPDSTGALDPWVLKGLQGVHTPIIRETVTRTEELCDQEGLAIGGFLPEGMVICQKDSLEWTDNVDRLNPRQTKADPVTGEAYVYVNVKGKPIFRHQYLKSNPEPDEIDQCKDFKRGPETVAQYQARVKAAIAMEDEQALANAVAEKVQAD